MEHTAEGTHDHKHEVRCAGCGTVEVKGHIDLPWMIPHGLEEFPPDYYCETCYQVFRLYESTEEQIISALKAAGVHKTYQMEHLAKVLNELAGISPEALSAAFERGTMSALQRATPEREAA